MDLEVAPESALAEPRHRIDAIDAELVSLLARRMAVVHDVLAIKRAQGIPAALPRRVDAVIAHVRNEAAARQCPPDLAEAVWRTIIDWTIAFEDGVLGQESLSQERLGQKLLGQEGSGQVGSGHESLRQDAPEENP